MLTLFVAAAAALGAVPAATDAQQVAAVEAERVGHLLYDFDQAAWVTTDSLLAALGGPTKEGVRGWIVENDGADQIVTYYGLRGGSPYKIFVVRVRGDKIVSSARMQPGNDDVMTVVERRMVSARDAVLNRKVMATAKVQLCAPGSPNTVVLPPIDPDGLITVYILTPQATAETLPFGGHYRFQVDARNRVVAARSFTKSCANLTKPTTSGDGQPVALFITHSLVAKVPVYVGIVPKLQIWTADGQQVTPVGTMPAPSANHGA